MFSVSILYYISNQLKIIPNFPETSIPKNVPKKIVVEHMKLHFCCIDTIITYMKGIKSC